MHTLAKVIPFFLLLSTLGADWKGSVHLDRAITEAIEGGLTPGAVVWVESSNNTLHHQAYGARSLHPKREETTADTIYDCASLTKVVATAPSIMMLVEEGKVRLNHRVTEYLPEFRGSTRITIRQLLTHYSGLRPDLDLKPAWSGYDTGLAKAYVERPIATPGSKFIYSDINYILLGEIVHRVSGKPLNEFARERIFVPLGMNDSGFLPDRELRERIAPTEQLADGSFLRGRVHDPTTRFMGGVAGHAGMFSTAADLARFARMMLNGGELNGSRILSPLSVLQMTTPQSPSDKKDRGLGWDLNSPYASVRGDLFVEGSFGHTGYTGTSMWMDPFSDTFVVLMTNRVYPDDSTSVVTLRSKVASIVAATMESLDLEELRRRRWNARSVDVPVAANVQTGLDVLVREGFRSLRGKRVGLITNHTGIDREGRRNVDLIAAADGVELAAILTPEHGLGGVLDQSDIGDGRDERTGVPVWSLYRPERRRPSAEMLEDLDALVFDVQDVGARFYTYITTMGYAMEEASKAGIEFVVLDRPNPITGTRVEGPSLDEDLRSFVGYHAMPVRHGMTVGELAQMFNEERKVGVELTVVKMSGWNRELWFDETGLPWVNPSPNIRSLDQAVVYPAIATLEGLKNYSVGRGTDRPFRFIGADWIDGPKLAQSLTDWAVPGVRFYSRRLTPDASHFSGEEIDGVEIGLVDRNSLDNGELALAIAVELSRQAPDGLDWPETDKLFGSRSLINKIERGAGSSEIEAEISDGVAKFLERRRRFLLY